jgi:hypothetical protein
LDNEAVQQALGASGFPIGEVRTLTAETDPDNLLGRPNQYTVKVSWKDARAPFDDSTMEVFPDDASLKARKDYSEAISRSGGLSCSRSTPASAGARCCASRLN